MALSYGPELYNMYMYREFTLKVASAHYLEGVPSVKIYSAGVVNKP